MAKSRRQREIVRLIESQPVRTHDDLAAALADRGIVASQGTLSRDLRELGVVKTAAGYAASVPDEVGTDRDGALASALSQFLVTIRIAQNLVILRTYPGGASALALSLDVASWPEIVGTIAGDDTIFVATHDNQTARRVREMLDGLWS